mmetsp:Transcript_10155/g.25348  ORF Transcript_10155/g.25348 Transcript_10155/m.25348 type:complete len:358 (+) Transcript_10155:1414-2487(+)
MLFSSSCRLHAFFFRLYGRRWVKDWEKRNASLDVFLDLLGGFGHRPVVPVWGDGCSESAELEERRSQVNLVVGLRQLGPRLLVGLDVKGEFPTELGDFRLVLVQGLPVGETDRQRCHLPSQQAVVEPTLHEVGCLERERGGAVARAGVHSPDGWDREIVAVSLEDDIGGGRVLGPLEDAVDEVALGLVVGREVERVRPGEREREGGGLLGFFLRLGDLRDSLVQTRDSEGLELTLVAHAAVRAAAAAAGLVVGDGVDEGELKQLGVVLRDALSDRVLDELVHFLKLGGLSALGQRGDGEEVVVSAGVLREGGAGAERQGRGEGRRAAADLREQLAPRLAEPQGLRLRSRGGKITLAL